LRPCSAVFVFLLKIVTNSAFSSFVAIYTVRRILEDARVPENVIQAVKERMYVHDYLGSASSVAEAVDEVITVKNALSSSDLNLQA
jgi:uncharacterized protein (UPF0147 family)